MANAVPVLCYVPLETLQDLPGSPQLATRKAKALWEEYTRSIASAANEMEETSLLVRICKSRMPAYVRCTVA